MNRHTVNNVLVSLAGVLGETNAEADAEIADLRMQVMQLQAALAQHRAVVVAARDAMHAVPCTDGTGEDLSIPAARVQALRVAIRECP